MNSFMSVKTWEQMSRYDPNCIFQTIGVASGAQKSVAPSKPITVSLGFPQRVYDCKVVKGILLQA
jgi:hypothetical protein